MVSVKEERVFTVKTVNRPSGACGPPKMGPTKDLSHEILHKGEGLPFLEIKILAPHMLVCGPLDFSPKPVQQRPAHPPGVYLSCG